MERYFRLTEESALQRDFIAYKNNAKVLRELIIEFNTTHGIKSGVYYATDEALYIIPTESDLEKHSSVLCAPIEEGLRKFKVNSRIGKAWVKGLKDKNLSVLRKPPVAFYFPRFGGGRIQSRIFEIDGVVYCSMNPCEESQISGMVEMKASEFFKVIEESETKEG